MKLKTLSMMAALLGPVVISTNAAVAEPAKEDLTKVYEAGRRAFNKGDLAAAKVAFTKVLRAKPDFDLANIYMAQIRHAEAQWEARPRSQKIAEHAEVAAVDLVSVTLGDALEVVRRELEKAGGGTKAGRIEILTDVPDAVLQRPVTLSVRKLPMTHFKDIVAFTGDVGIAWHPQGLSVTVNAAPPDKMDVLAASDGTVTISITLPAHTAGGQSVEDGGTTHGSRQCGGPGLDARSVAPLR